MSSLERIDSQKYSYPALSEFAKVVENPWEEKEEEKPSTEGGIERRLSQEDCTNSLSNSFSVKPLKDFERRLSQEDCTNLLPKPSSLNPLTEVIQKVGNTIGSFFRQGNQSPQKRSSKIPVVDGYYLVRWPEENSPYRLCVKKDSKGNVISFPIEERTSSEELSDKIEEECKALKTPERKTLIHLLEAGRPLGSSIQSAKKDTQKCSPELTRN